MNAWPRVGIVAALQMLVLCCHVSAVFAAPAQSGRGEGSDYPSRPIRLIVPSSPGGGTDITARMIAAALTTGFGQQVIVDNRSGATGNIGAVVAAKATPDGYTLLTFANTLTADAGSRRNLPYDLVKDFTPITQTSSLPYMLIIHPSLPARSLKELVALAKAKPGIVSYASSGIGGLSHLAGGLLGMLTHADFLHVPYKGGAPALTDLLAGQVNMLFSTPLQAAAHLRSGKLLALAVTTKTRLKTHSDVPTLIEAGVPGYEVNVWNGMVAPAGLPASIVRKIYAETLRALETIKPQLAKDGSETVGSTPAAFAAFIKEDIAKWRKTADFIGLRLD